MFFQSLMIALTLLNNWNGWKSTVSFRKSTTTLNSHALCISYVTVSDRQYVEAHAGIFSCVLNGVLKTYGNFPMN